MDDSVRSTSLSLSFFTFQNSKLYSELSQLEKEVVNDYIYNLLNYLKIMESISDHELEEFFLDFIKSNGINNIYTKGLLKKINRYIISRKLEIYFSWSSKYYYDTDYSIFSYEEERLISKFLKTLIKKENFFVTEEYNKVILEYKRGYTYEIELRDFMIENNLKEEQFLTWLKWKAGLKPSEYYNNTKKERFASEEEYDPSCGIQDAEQLILRYTDEIIGVILFYPNKKSQVDGKTEFSLINGLVVRRTNFDELIYYPYLGYIVLHSHKPRLLDEFKIFLKKEKVKYYEVADDDNIIYEWNKCCGVEGDLQKERIKEVVNKYLKFWTKKLKQVKGF